MQYRLLEFCEKGYYDSAYKIIHSNKYKNHICINLNMLNATVKSGNLFNFLLYKKQEINIFDTANFLFLNII